MPYYRINNSDFNLWLQQPIWISNTVRDRRRDILLEFNDCVTQLLKNKGYVMDERWNSTTSFPLLSWIYRIAVEETARYNYNNPVSIPPIIHRNTQEDYDYFYHIIDDDTIEQLMDEWSDVEDLSIDSRIGARVRTEIQEFLYTFVDLESSKQGKVIARFWENDGSDSDHELSSRDNYLKDAIEGFHGGKGSKV